MRAVIPIIALTAGAILIGSGCKEEKSPERAAPAVTVQPAMNKLADANITQALASFIKIVGTINDPKIRIDDKEAIKTLIGVAATGGATYIGSQMLLDGDGSPCYTALQGTAYASRFPKPTGVKATTQEVYKDTTKQINKDITNLKNAAQGFLRALKNNR